MGTTKSLWQWGAFACPGELRLKVACLGNAFSTAQAHGARMEFVVRANDNVALHKF